MLFKETPDTVYDFVDPVTGQKQDINYRRSDAVSFIVFEDGFAIYATSDVLPGYEYEPESFAGHGQLIDAYFASQMSDDQIQQRSNQSALERRREQAAKYVKTIGKPSEKTKKMFDTNLQGPGNFGKHVRGRFWTIPKVMSYWIGWGDSDAIINDPKIKRKIFDIIKAVGEDPKKYTYEVGSNFLTYDEFSKGSAVNQEDEQKEYELGGKKYKESFLNILRTNMHVKTGVERDNAVSTLCSILDDEALHKYPELRGYVPPNCSQVKSPEQRIKDALRTGKPEFMTNLTQSLSPDRGWNKGRTQPIKTTTLSPGDEAGKLPGASPFRARTQKELDRAWDMFKQTKNPDAGFKEWLQIVENLL